MQRRSRRNALTLLFLLTALAACLPACRSVYDNAKQDLPADLDERLDARIRSARDAAEVGLDALNDPPSADRAEAAGWDLAKATDSIGDVLERMPKRQPDATALHRNMQRASKALDSAVDQLAGSSPSRATESVKRAQGSLRAAIAAADEFLKANAPAP